MTDQQLDRPSERPARFTALSRSSANKTTDPAPVTSVASGLVYPGIGPEVAMLYDEGRLQVAAIADDEVIECFFRITKSEGMIPALESSHAIAFAIELAAKRPSSESILVNLSGRGDKDVEYVLDTYGTDFRRD